MQTKNQTKNPVCSHLGIRTIIYLSLRQQQAYILTTDFIRYTDSTAHAKMQKSNHLYGSKSMQLVM